MRIGVSSAVFYPMKSEDSFDRLIKIGFSEAEFFYNCEYELSEEFIHSLSKKLKSGNMSLVSMHPFTAFAEGVFLFSDYERRTEEQILKYEKVFQVMGSLGAKFFTFHGDRAYRGICDEDCILRQRDIKTFTVLCNAAKKNGVTLCLENVSWCKSANLKYLKSVYENLPDVGFTLDLKQARRAGVSVYEYIDVMGDRIKNIHVSDYSNKSDCLLPGEGEFDFVAFFDKLKQTEYDGDLIIEVYSSGFSDDKQLVKSKKFLCGLIGK